DILMQLDLKAGRIRLNDMNNRYFVSTETCKAIHRQRLFTGNTYFPVNPLELNRKRLEKQYKLSLKSRYSQANGHRIYVIHCQPRKYPRGQFEATMWVDSTARQLLKVKLTGEDLTIHPFDPIWPSDTLKRVDLDITKTFAARDGKMYLKKVDFNYRLHYQYGDGVRAEVTTDAVMYAYDYAQRFDLPHMEFSDGAYEDYIKINAIPYNRFFWDNMDEFKVHDAAHTGHWGQGASLDSRTMFLSNPAFERGILESPYVWWDEKRVFFRGTARGVNDLSKYESWAPAERYNLKVQFFMDLTQMRDSLHRMTGVVFDPYQSFFHYPNTPESNAFMNLYFDLMEIERQDLEARLHQPGMTVDRAKAIYKKHQQQARDVQKHFLSEVQRGTQRAPMVRWNDRVKARLGIDNLALFGVYQAP
ncbi:MAG: hypothetical protein AAGB22_07025, partial [Bacteroidota bacterium]